MIITGIKTSIFQEGNSLLDFIKKHVSFLQEGDILVITSKIVALSEGRTGEIEKKRELILRESKKVIETPWAMLTLTTDGWVINAGIDESNANKKLILLPKNSFKTAEYIRKQLVQHFNLKKVGVLITDTKSTPLRVGTVGRALGYAGFKPLKSYIGADDIFGRKSRLTVSNLADAIATSAVMVMGEGAERMPMAVVKEAPIIFVSKPLPKQLKNLILSPEQDIFSKVFISVERESRKISKKHSKRQKL